MKEGGEAEEDEILGRSKERGRKRSRKDGEEKGKIVTWERKKGIEESEEKMKEVG